MSTGWSPQTHRWWATWTACPSVSGSLPIGGASREALEAEISRGAGDGPRAHQLRAMLGRFPDPHHPGRRVRRQFITLPTPRRGDRSRCSGGRGRRRRGAAVYVPGTGTKMDSAGANRTAAWNFANRSGAPVFLLHGRTVPAEPRRRGVAGLRDVDGSQSRGLLTGARRRVADHAPGRRRPIGHSYGGAVVGTAEQLGLRADRVVYASASGTGVLPGGADAWVNHDAAQRYSVTPPGDPIQPVQSSGAHGGDPDNAPGSPAWIPATTQRRAGAGRARPRRLLRRSRQRCLQEHGRRHPGRAGDTLRRARARHAASRVTRVSNTASSFPSRCDVGVRLAVVETHGMCAPRVDSCRHLRPAGSPRPHPATASGTSSASGRWLPTGPTSWARRG